MGPVHLCLNFALLERYREERRLASASEHPLCARCFLLPRGGGEARKVRLQEEKLTSPGSPWGFEAKWPFCPTTCLEPSPSRYAASLLEDRARPPAGRQAAVVLRA